MKKFEDLTFETHPHFPYFESYARMNFENGFGISVINGYSAYCNDNTYEVAVLSNNEICYSTHITDDVIGYCTKAKVTKLMKQIQEL